MPRLLLGSEDLAKVRVSTSWGPFTEVLLSLRLLTSDRPNALVDGWRQAVQAQVGPETALLHAVTPRGSLIDLHTVVGEAPTIDAALEGLEAAPSEHMRGELASLWPAAAGTPAWAQAWVRDLADGDRRARRELATRFREYHQHAVDPYWGSLRRYLDAEGARRARTMAEGGVDRLLATLHPLVRWRAPFLDVGPTARTPDPGSHGRLAAPPRPIVLDGRSLVLVPAVFALEGPYVLRNSADTTQPYVLLYPALRDADDAMALWTPPAEASSQRALAMLLGRTRARALEAIADTCTTTELAQRISVSPPTASHHIGVLRAAGLIASCRVGNTVLHSLTARGAALLRN